MPPARAGHRPARRRPGAGDRGADRLQEADPVLPGRRRRGRPRRASSAARATSPSATRGRRAARRRAARRLRDRRPDDLRPRLRRDDLLGPRARRRRRPRRHPGAGRGHRRPGRRAPRPARSSAWTTWSSTWRSPPTAATAWPCAASPARWAPAWPRPGATRPRSTPPAWSGEPAWTGRRSHDPERCDRFSMLAVEGLDPTAPSPWWLRRRLAQAGIRSDLAGRRRHQLRDARARPADARLRPGRACTGPIIVRRPARASS